MNNKTSIFATLALAAAAVAGIQPAHAADYAFRVPAVGVRSPDIMPTFGAFSVPTRAVDAGAFQLSPPSSNSSGAFTYTSSNPAVATITGNTVTPVAPGTTIITATQAPGEGYQGGSVTANFVVGAPAGYISSGGLLWQIPKASVGNLKGTDALSYCQYGGFLGRSGWRLPTKDEAVAMVNDVGSARLTELGWTAWAAWTSTTMPSNMLTFDRNGNLSWSEYSSNYRAVTCVR